MLWIIPLILVIAGIVFAALFLSYQHMEEQRKVVYVAWRNSTKHVYFHDNLTLPSGSMIPEDFDVRYTARRILEQEVVEQKRLDPESRCKINFLVSDFMILGYPNRDSVVVMSKRMTGCNLPPTSTYAWEAVAITDKDATVKGQPCPVIHDALSNLHPDCQGSGEKYFEVVNQ